MRNSRVKTEYCADRSILALPSAHQECPVTLKLMTSQVVQRPVGSQRVNIRITSHLIGVKKQRKFCWYLRSFPCFALHILTVHNLWRHSRALVHVHIENMSDLP